MSDQHFDQYNEFARREIVTTRVFDAPRALVFAAWTDPEQLKLWWGPRGFTNTFETCEMKPGGVWKYVMHGPGRDFQNEILFVEIAEPERIVMDHLSPPQFRLTAIFEEMGSRTKLTFRQLFATPDFVSEPGILRFKRLTSVLQLGYLCDREHQAIPEGDDLDVKPFRLPVLYDARLKALALARSDDLEIPMPCC